MRFQKKFRPQKRRNSNSTIKNGRKKFKSNDEEIPEQKNTIEKTISSEDSSSEEEAIVPNSIEKLLSTFGNSVESNCEDEGESSDEVHAEDDDNGAVEDEEGEDQDSDVAEESELDEEEDGDVSENEGLNSSAEEESSSESDSVADIEETCQETTDDKIDPFNLHFERNIGKANGEQIEDVSKWSSNSVTWSCLGKIKIESPSLVPVKKSFLLLDDVDDSPLPEVGVKIKHDLPVSLENYFLKVQLQTNLKNYTQKMGKSKELNDVQGELLSIVTQYADLYYPESTYEKWDDIGTVYSTHIINHILKTRKRIIQHNGKINRKKVQADYEYNDTFRDQGYTRPKVLVLLPFKHSAFVLMQKIILLLFGNSNDDGDVRHWKRFEEDFGPPEKSNEHINRPEDFNKTFEGDYNEDFKIGITLTKKCLKLYTDFYNSDIIIASPLGLRYTVGTAGEKDYDCAFLSSIEILIMDHADIFLMQNWEHVMVLMESLNNLPKDIQKLSTDLGRIRYWSLDGLSKLYRQTIVFSSTVVDHNRALFLKGRNLAGRVQVLNHVENGSVSEVVVPSQLLLYKVNGDDSDSRFNYFTQKFLPSWRKSHGGHTLLYVPDYCDYVRLVRFIKEDGGTSLATINEYMVSQNSKVAKARSLFFDGKREMLLYTERFHFYRRYRIKGVKHVIFYDFPTYPHFFPEICNFMVDGLQNAKIAPLLGAHQISCLYQSCTARLIGVLGAERAAKIISSAKPIHMCSIGS